MRSFAFPAVLLTLAVSQGAYAEYGYEDFLKAVESGQQKNAQLNAPRLAQLPSDPEELPVPKPNDTGLSVDGPQSSPSDREVDVPPISPPIPNAPAAIPLDAPSVVQPPSQTTSPVLPNPINFADTFAQQEVGLSGSADFQTSASSDCDYGPVGAPARASCSTGACGVRSCNPMVHSPVQLPPPSTLLGYFNASPCVAHVWDGYACDATKECRKTYQHIQNGQSSSHAGLLDKATCE